MEYRNLFLVARKLQGCEKKKGWIPMQSSLFVIYLMLLQLLIYPWDEESQ